MNITSKLLLSLLLTTSFFTSFGFIVKRECSPESRNTDQSCPTSLNYVCAHFTGDNCDSDLCQKFAVNECFACKDPSVQFYTSGLCQSDKIYCEDTTRNLFPDTCDDGTSNQVCAYTTQGCLEGECALSTGSECNVCADSRVDYYRPGSCKVEDILVQCAGSDSFCSGQAASPPICLYNSGCQGDDCAETFVDQCTGCSQYPNSYYKGAPCEKDRNICSPDSSEENCKTTTTSSGPVCAYFKLFDYDQGNTLYQTTVQNSCTACQDVAVGYYTSGECSTTPATTQTFCLPSHNPVECDMTVNEPVCGFKESIRFDSSKADFSNGCSACQDANVTYYQSGTCSYQCPDYYSLSVDIMNCNGSFVEPICAYSQIYSDSSEVNENDENVIIIPEENEAISEENRLTQSNDEGNIIVIDGLIYSAKSIKNSCVACFDLSSSLTVSFYKQGLCPGDEGIRCDNEGVSYYYGSISPVCGIFSEGCSDSSCRTTFAEPLAACKLSSAVMYTPGYCPGDQGVSCKLYRSKFDTVCDGMDSYSVPVCGYSSANCQDDSCKTTYKNQCYACSDSSVQFFTNGACGN